MSYNPNGGDALKLLTVFRKNGLKISISWIINSSEAVASYFRNLDSLADCWGDFPHRGFQVSARWDPMFMWIFFKLCRTRRVEIGFTFVIYHSLFQLFFKVDLSFAEFPPALLKVKKIGISISLGNPHQIRNSEWESTLPHVLQQFVGTNSLTEGILFNNLRT